MGTEHFLDVFIHRVKTTDSNKLTAHIHNLILNTSDLVIWPYLHENLTQPIFETNLSDLHCH